MHSGSLGVEPNRISSNFGAEVDGAICEPTTRPFGPVIAQKLHLANREQSKLVSYISDKQKRLEGGDKIQIVID